MLLRSAAKTYQCRSCIRNVLPNPSFERKRDSEAPQPRGVVVHHPRGQGATSMRSYIASLAKPNRCTNV